jgi:hemoglobin-like flavoprotein
MAEVIVFAFDKCYRNPQRSINYECSKKQIKLCLYLLMQIQEKRVLAFHITHNLRNYARQRDCSQPHSRSHQGGSMSVTEAQKEIIRDTFSRLKGNTDAFAATFYNRLFELDPSLRRLFKANIDEQGKKLMQILGVAVSSLNDLSAIVPAVQALGTRHIKYGVQQEHYATVGIALVWTLEQYLKTDFTLEVQDAWIAVYTLLADVAISHAYQPVAEF